ncbi:MAG: ATP-binding protein [Thermodesulfobacteriota bacterium]
MKPGIGLKKNLRKAMAAQDRDVSRVIGWLAAVAAAVVILSTPAVYFAIAYKSLDAAMRVEADVTAREVGRIVGGPAGTPEERLARALEFLERRVTVGDAEYCRIVGDDGRTLAETASRPALPVIVRGSLIPGGWDIAGVLQVRRSLRPLLRMAGVFLLLGGILGAAVYYAFRILPLAALRKALGQLAREKERAQTTLRSIADGVIAIDAAGNVELMNESAEQVSGWSREEAVGRPIGEVFRTQDGGAGREPPGPLEEAASGGGGGRKFLLCPNGSRRLVDYSVAPIPDGRGGSAGTVVVFRDVTQKVREEEELQKLQRLESLGNLAGGIAHGFNNYLAGILGNISLGKQSLDPGGRAYARLEEAEKACGGASELATKLLTFSKGGSPVRELIRLDAVVRDAAATAARGSETAVSYDIAGDLMAAHADAGQVGQAVHNLVQNAVQAMSGKGEVRIRIANVTVKVGGTGSLKAGRYVRVDVTDDGPGIPPEELERVLEPYFTTRENRNGLGLTIAYHILKSHGGDLIIDSEPGSGTTASLFLPASEEHPPSAEDLRGTAPPECGQRVLVMDDEDLVREMAQGILEHIGCESAGARNGEEAVRMYGDAARAGRPFDLVIMDLVIPAGMGGKEASRQILRSYPDARLIVSSGYSSDPIMADHLSHGFRGVLPKPYRVEDFVRVVRKVLAG